MIQQTHLTTKPSLFLRACDETDLCLMECTLRNAGLDLQFYKASSHLLSHLIISVTVTQVMTVIFVLCSRNLRLMKVR